MSKSSGTNSPTLQLWSVCWKVHEAGYTEFFLSLTPYTEGHREGRYDLQGAYARDKNGGNSDGDPPLPIPNREVKPVIADGTAIPSGRVGSRQLSESIQRNLDALFFVCI